jgi:hypothetical protein
MLYDSIYMILELHFSLIIVLLFIFNSANTKLPISSSLRNYIVNSISPSGLSLMNYTFYQICILLGSVVNLAVASLMTTLSCTSSSFTMQCDPHCRWSPTRWFHCRSFYLKFFLMLFVVCLLTVDIVLLCTFPSLPRIFFPRICFSCFYSFIILCKLAWNYRCGKKYFSAFPQ